MVASSAQSLRKRKATTDMPDSPPKRVTRARAKANDDAEPSIKIKTASARVVADMKPATKLITKVSTKAPTKTVTATKRKTRADDAAEHEIETSNVEQIVAGPKPRGRPKKIVEDECNDSIRTEAPKTRSRQTKAMTKDGAPEALKPKVRPKKQTGTSENGVLKGGNDIIEPVEKTTRSRAAASTKSTGVTAPKPATLRKKVTFEDDSQQDKENLPAPSEESKKAGSKASGLRAKPVRKPAPTRATRNRKPAQALQENMQEDIVKPLSPKKVTQIAKSISISSEDELVGDRTPPKASFKSPTKPPASIRREVAKVDTVNAVPTSPTRVITAMIMGSPARRPAPSPFKDSLKDSPKKVSIMTATTAPNLSTTQLPFKSSLMESPKRMNFITAAAGSAQFSAQSPFKSSLLQSPARRPMSPMKTSVFGLPSKSSMAMPVVNVLTASKDASTIGLPAITPQRLFCSPLRATRIVESSEKMHNKSVAEQYVQKLREEPGAENDVFVINDENNNQDRMGINPISHSIPISLLADIESSAVLAEAATTADCESFDKLESSGTTPPGVPQVPTSAPAPFASPAYRNLSEDSESEDELQSGENTGMTSPSRRPLAMKHVPKIDATPASGGFSKISKSPSRQPRQETACGFINSPYGATSQSIDLSMTPLATQFSSWLASSPDKQQQGKERVKSRGIFSPADRPIFSRPDQGYQSIAAATLGKSTYFEDEMIVRDQENVCVAEEQENVKASETLLGTHVIFEDAGKESQEIEEYGDENTMPIDPQILGLEPEPNVQQVVGTITPARIFQSNVREIHTISKVPLRASDNSPLVVPRKRGRSVSGPLTEVTEMSRPRVCGNDVVSFHDFDDKIENNNVYGSSKATPTKTVGLMIDNRSELATPLQESVSTYVTPFRSVRKGTDAQILRGAVVYVDVHTTEGADASGIFVELLTDMGARCVKQWHWNPRASMSNPSEANQAGQDENQGESTPGGKVGITHVVFKDGGKRTLQKVRETKGLVLCVGVGWVLNCERENTWLDEAEYAVDTSTIPRGGHNRRKSMEPGRLSIVNGSLVQAETPSRKVSFEFSPTKEFLNFGTPAVRESMVVPKTPQHAEIVFDDNASWASPTTPYFLSRGAELVQQTCPPKQLMQPLFPLSGRIEDQPDQAIRQRLLLARRKSLQWAPKVGSPLGKAMTYEK